MKTRTINYFKLLIPVLAVIAAMSIGVVLILIEKASPVEAYRILLTSSFSSTMNFGETLIKAIPIGFTGLAVAWAYRGGAFNIGVEGQLLMGAAGGIAIALRCPGLPPAIVIPLSIIAGAVVGGFWAYIPAVLKARRNINEVISTIMLNYIGKYLVSWLINGPLQEAARHNPQTEAIEKAFYLPTLIPGTRVHWGLALLVIVCVIEFYVLFYSSAGYRLRVVGLNKDAAAYAGICINRNIILAMVVSGAIAGIGGTVEMLGIQHRLIDGFGNNYGFDGIAIALIGQLNPFGTLLAALLFGVLRTGANSMQRLAGVPTSVVEVIQGLIIFFVVCSAGIRLFAGRKKNRPRTDGGKKV